MAVIGNDDTTWSRATTPGERLRWARSKSGFTQESFADGVGYKRGAYRKYEADATSLKFEQAAPWSKKLKVRWEWLLDGKGLPWADHSEAGRTRPAALIAEIVDAADPDEQERILAVVQAMRKSA